MKSRPQKSRRRVREIHHNDFRGKLEVVHPHAAGIDVGNDEHFVAVPPGSDPEGRMVRSFRSVTAECHRMVEWLRVCKIDTVAMQSTGVYWFALYRILQQAGFQVFLVNASHTKNLPGRKTDVQECQWIMQLHAYGMLSNSFIPEEHIRTLRTIWRQRSSHVAQASHSLQRMQKALVTMNLRFHNIAKDIASVTALRMIRAIVAGERDVHKLAQLREPGIQATQQEIVESLEGTWQADQIFCLRQHLSLFDTYHDKIQECDVLLAQYLGTLPDQPGAEPLSPLRRNKRPKGNAPPVAVLDIRTELHRITGVDLTSIDGINVLVAQTIISECGTDLSAWPSEGQFVAWLRLCPRPDQSGRTVKRRATGRTRSPVTVALRQAATALVRSKTYLGAKYRRLQAKLGKKGGVTAMAGQLARLVYRLMQHGHAYVDKGAAYYEAKLAASKLAYLRKQAAHLGLHLIENTEAA